jgi:hypothetical protein
VSSLAAWSNVFAVGTQSLGCGLILSVIPFLKPEMRNTAGPCYRFLVSSSNKPQFLKFQWPGRTMEYLTAMPYSKLFQIRRAPQQVAQHPEVVRQHAPIHN